MRADAGALAADQEEIRQVEWERREYYREIHARGQARTRRYCAVHRRYCRWPATDHPPGGARVEPAPADFQPEGWPKQG